MPLKPIIDKLEDVAPGLRDHYAAKDGKYHLTLDGEHPDTAKVKEMRQTAIDAVKEREAIKARFEGIDPAAVAADKAKLAELLAAKPDARITELETQLASEKAARTAAQAAADASVLNALVTAKFIKAGGRGNALDFILSKASSVFEVVNGVPVGKIFDPDKPGEKLTVDGFINMQARESDFAFKESSGGGATGNKGGGGATGGAGVLKDPTPQQLGQFSKEIKEGKIRVEYSNG